MLDEAQLETLRRLLLLAEHYRLAELEVEAEGLHIQIRSQAGASAGVPGAGAPEGADYEGEPAEGERLDPDLGANCHPVTSPMTGTFFRAEGPESPPFVEVGQHVDQGQTIGLLEAMKVFSQIPADRSGRVVDFRVKNGHLVQQGDILLLLEPDGGA